MEKSEVELQWIFQEEIWIPLLCVLSTSSFALPLLQCLNTLGPLLQEGFPGSSDLVGNSKG